MIKICSFKINITPPLGARICGSNELRAKSVRDPLFARGIILDDGKKRVVFCGVDLCGIAGEIYHEWKTVIAKAAKTTPEFVALHSVHQHQAPWLMGYDLVEKETKNKSQFFGVSKNEIPWMKGIYRKLHQTISSSLKKFELVESFGTGKTEVKGLAANRRIINPKNKSIGTRWSITRDPKVKSQPIGLIDPSFQSISFWGGNKKLLATLHFYATHPQCCGNLPYFSGEAPGEMHRLLTQKHPEAFHLYLSGCLGNVTCGKYSTPDAEKNIQLLGKRLAQGALKSIEKSKRSLQIIDRLEFKSVPFAYPTKIRTSLKGFKEKLKKVDPKDWDLYSMTMAKMSKNNSRYLQGLKITCWTLGNIKILSLPGEPFIEYQLFAKGLDPQSFIAVAGLGEYTPVYIPTAIALSQGGYEVDPAACFADQSVEKKLKSAIKKALL